MVLRFLTFTVLWAVVFVPVYAIEFDDDEEDAEDMANLLE